MADNVVTPPFRATFISILRAKAQKLPDGTMGAAKYSIRAAFPPTADLKALQEQAKTSAFAKWGDKMPKALRSPFRTNDELDNPIPGIGDDWIIVTFSASEDRKPGVVDANLQDIMDEAEIYSGAWFRAEVRGFAYDNAGNRGVSFGLQNVMKVKDDEPLGAGRAPANKAFAAFAPTGTSGKSAADIFG
jgi:hypothetical protein